jgi:hypothetical protein
MRYGDRERTGNRDADRDRGRNRDRNRNDNRAGSGQDQRQDLRDRRGRSRRRRRRDFPRRPREQQRRDGPPCPVCERMVQELTSAITHTESGQPAHFDCIMKKIEQAEGVGANERLCYLGKGSFGILRFQKNAGNIPFIIRKRIQYENLEETPEWRKKLDQFSNARDRDRNAANKQANNPPPVQEERRP